ncbi:hypothetical protein KY290_017955 [Solanum tuberosum]|uniref:Uncharacterized protein n=1 Tax=Solanum tuberosum TaxID=4113 RepID=A0ABQ7VCT2_SOLTU|nr:hypothetical protein KY289_017118 [Solanum tuberosum]KAH0702639.1 hypothetical protein KY285_016917 [Solanum tuberosum]KAH0761882.1 hypothetical protein KY290_017955 [Solanum tuberosum]
MDFVSLNAGSSNPRNFKTSYSTGNGNQNKGNFICEYCKRPGHTVSKYYKLHGYPPDNSQSTSTQNAGYNRNNQRYNNSRPNKNNNNNRIAANAHGPSGDEMSGKGENDSKEEQPLSLTKE